MITSVVGYHMDSLRCGVARFNFELARQLGVPHLGLHGHGSAGERPLLSLKVSEMSAADIERLRVDVWQWRGGGTQYHVLWHDEGDAAVNAAASGVMYAWQNGWWCPGAPLPPVERRALRLLTAGMAHKLHTPPYAVLRDHLAGAGADYEVRVSVLLHESTSVTDAEMHFDALDGIFGSERVNVLGCLSNVALAEELASADAVVAFVVGGARPNNTSIHTAMAAGCPVITNLGPLSPVDWVHGETVFDVHRLAAWPSRDHLDRVAAAGQRLYRERYDWPHLIARLREATA